MNQGRYLLAALAALLLSVLPNLPAEAHRVNIFCWVDQAEIICESGFPDGKPVSGGAVTVQSKETGETLLKTRTNEQGRASFPIPDKAVRKSWNLKVSIDASMGHKSSWTVGSEELARPQAGGKQPAASKEPASSGPSGQILAGQEERDRIPLSEERLEQLVARAVSREIAPLKRELQSLKQERVSISDVLGGLGYILGLMGIVLYFKSRGSGRE